MDLSRVSMQNFHRAIENILSLPSLVKWWGYSNLAISVLVLDLFFTATAAFWVWGRVHWCKCMWHDKPELADVRAASTASICHVPDNASSCSQLFAPACNDFQKITNTTHLKTPKEHVPLTPIPFCSVILWLIF